MHVEPVPLIRAAYPNLLMEVTGRCGRNDPAFVQQSNLPLNLDHKPDAYVVLQAVLSFAQWVARRTGIEDLGLQVGFRLQVSHFGGALRGALLSAASLEDALERFAGLADGEQSSARYWAVRSGDEVRICSSVGSLSLDDADGFGEWLRIMSVMIVIRHFAGDSWTPLAITLQSRREPGQHVRRAFPRTGFSTGHTEAGIAFPASLLGLSTIKNCSPHGLSVMSGNHSAASASATWTFPASLREVIQAHLDDGYPDIGLVASIIGCSVRTLQRRLRQFDLSYTDVVQQARFKLATHLLRDPDKKVIDAALAVGYEDPAHFTRAFRRLAGVTPNQYRKLNYVQ